MSQVEQLELLEDLEGFSNELDALQREENDGRGVSCIRTLLVYLRRGDLSAARAIINNEFDKIRNYPNIKDKIWELDTVFAKEVGWPLEEDLESL
jgi:hypothetical protein